jgi:hypothetical protein
LRIEVVLSDPTDKFVLRRCGRVLEILPKIAHVEAPPIVDFWILLRGVRKVSFSNPVRCAPDLCLDASKSTVSVSVFACFRQL